MYCMQCGSQNVDGSSFCEKCGKPLMNMQGQPKTADAAMKAMPVAVAPMAAATPAPAANMARGCVSLAWEDVKDSEGWLKRILLLGLIQLVPILCFVVPGYAAQWGKDPILNRKRSLPKAIFEDRTFITGFFCAVLAVVVFLVIYFGAGIVGLLLGSFLGYAGVIVAVIVGMAIGVFGAMFIFACNLRIALAQRIGAGFQWGEIWNGAKGHWGALFGASFIPPLLSGLIVFAISFVISLLFGVIAGVNMIGLAGGLSYSSSSSAAMGNLVGILGSLGIAGFVTAYISGCAIAAAQVISFRAVGYWVVRFAPSWAALAEPVVAVPYGAPSATGGVGAAGGQPIAAGFPAGAPASAAQVPAVQAAAASAAAPAPMPMPSPAPHMSPVSTTPKDEDVVTTVLATPEAAGSLRIERSDGTVVTVTEFPATLGKGSAATVQLSGNGTILNGRPLQAGVVMALSNGDTLKLGDEALIVRF